MSCESIIDGPMDPATRMVTLTNDPPVEIVEEEWPIIARGKWSDSKLEYRARTVWIIVRRHVDEGRTLGTLVYGGFDTKWANERQLRGGELVERDDTPHAIRRVAAVIKAPEHLPGEVIARLPKVKI